MAKRVLKLEIVDENKDGKYLAIMLPEALASDCVKIEHPRALHGLLYDALTDLVQQRLAPMVAKALKQQEQFVLLDQHRRGEITNDELIERVERLNLDSTPTA